MGNFENSTRVSRLTHVLQLTHLCPGESEKHPRLLVVQIVKEGLLLEKNTKTANSGEWERVILGIPPKRGKGPFTPSRNRRQ